MPLTTEGIQLNYITFDPSDAIPADPLKTQQMWVTIHNGEPQDVLVKWSSNNKNKLTFQPSCAVIPSCTDMKFRLTMEALNTRRDSPRLHVSCRVVGCRNNKYRAKDIWADKKLWKEKVNTRIHKKLIFLEYANMMPEGWWKEDSNDDEVVCWGVEESEEGGANGAKETGAAKESGAAKKEDPKE